MPSHSNSTRPEILAPAGNADMLCAAVFAGADAVYLGLQNFNARRTAGNFTTEGLRQAVAFCHARDVRVYVTLNTTLYPGELTALAEAVAGIAAAGADAVITQDLAVAALGAPNGAGPGAARLHADERAEPGRCAPSGRAGFYTRDLARELTLSEIAGITAGCGIETETFVHGALCMSVSGQCYMSAFLGGRSGNRGGCGGAVPSALRRIGHARAGRGASSEPQGHVCHRSSAAAFRRGRGQCEDRGTAAPAGICGRGCQCLSAGAGG